MTIYIENTESAPALVFDRIFMDSLEIMQVSENDNNIPPKYGLRIMYRTFAVDDTGLRHFKSKVNVLQIEDYLQVAMAKAQSGDMDLMNAMLAIERALGAIIEDQTDLGQTTVTQ